jgi:hypothetical protein
MASGKSDEICRVLVDPHRFVICVVVIGKRTVAASSGGSRLVAVSF